MPLVRVNHFFCCMRCDVSRRRRKPSSSSVLSINLNSKVFSFHSVFLKRHQHDSLNIARLTTFIFGLEHLKKMAKSSSFLSSSVACSPVSWNQTLNETSKVCETRRELCWLNKCFLTVLWALKRGELCKIFATFWAALSQLVAFRTSNRID